MSTATEIEKAILTLPSDELEKLAGWWESFRTINSDPEERTRLAAIAATSGCLMGSQSDDFEAAVTEAGKGTENHNDW